MKIAYLITAYLDHTHLKRLINALKTEHTAFFIHIDGKVDITPFVSEINEPSVEFIDKRYCIYWGGYSQVLSIVALMEALINSEYTVDRVVLISGQDYPLYSNKEIEDVFVNSPETEFVRGFNITRMQEDRQSRKINQYHFLDEPISRKDRIERKIIKKFNLKRPNTVYFNKNKNDWCFGSDYWALTYDCVKYVYNTFKKSWILRWYLKYTYVPSEIFVQTILFNSTKYKDKTLGLEENKNPIRLVDLTPLHHIVYEDKIKVFELADYENLVATGRMFFRKATTSESTPLLDKIDTRRQADL